MVFRGANPGPFGVNLFDYIYTNFCFMVAPCRATPCKQIRTDPNYVCVMYVNRSMYMVWYNFMNPPRRRQGAGEVDYKF
jgi:hypothetical protein